MHPSNSHAIAGITRMDARVAVWTIVAFAGATAWAADAPAATDYERVIAGRADKILAALDGVPDEARERIRGTLLGFFRGVNGWHEAHGPRRRELRALDDAAARAELAALDAELARLRDDFVATLSADLSPEQVEKVKDGLTYNVLHVTERAYHEMIPTLSAAQKEMIRERLVEARDLAISEGSSEAKHAVFGRSKGRINNELSRQGYDLKAEERGWQDRRKASAAASATTGESK